MYVLQNQCNSGGRFFSSLVIVAFVSEMTVNSSNIFEYWDTHWSLFRYSAMGFQLLLLMRSARWRSFSITQGECEISEGFGDIGHGDS